VQFFPLAGCACLPIERYGVEIPARSDVCVQDFCSACAPSDLANLAVMSILAVHCRW